MPSDYDNFVLEISREEGVYVARVSMGEGGDARHSFQSPFRDVVHRDIRQASGERDTKRQLGQQLFSAVFGGRVGSYWTDRLRLVRQLPGRGLRLQLRLRSSDLWNWPWEYLYDPDEDFLALLPDVSIARYPEIPYPVRRLKIELPLRVLVVAAQPKDCSRLGLEREWEAMKSIAVPGRVELELLENASLRRLRQELQHPFHVFHFIGHGELNLKSRQGFLLFEKAGGERDSVSGRRLIRVLRCQPALRLVVLNACESSRTDRDDPFAGVAQRLVHGRIPAVVAMQFRVADEAAVVFSRRFYAALAEGKPIDAALSEARAELDAEPFEAEWGNPSLYLRSPDGLLFDVSLSPPHRPRHIDGRPKNRRTIHPPRRLWLWATLVLSATALGLALWLWSSSGPPKVEPDPGCPSPLGLDMPFARITEGEFTMGKARGPKEERPEHLVRISKPYCIGKFEVTQQQWKKVMGDNPSRHRDDDRPVEGVSWHDVQLFLLRLNRMDPSGRYRLPTEAEWEFAAVSGGGSPNPEDMRRFGNCRGWLDFYRKTAPVGRFRPNGRGIYDLYGNVAEWVSDWYGPYSSAALTDPTGPATGREMVRRGGFFGNNMENCSASYRASADPNRRAEDTGFRIVRDPRRMGGEEERRAKKVGFSSKHRELSAGLSLRVAPGGGDWELATEREPSMNSSRKEDTYG